MRESCSYHIVDQSHREFSVEPGTSDLINMPRPNHLPQLPTWPPQPDLNLMQMLIFVGICPTMASVIVPLVRPGVYGLFYFVCAAFRFQHSWRFYPLANPADITAESARIEVHLWVWKTLHDLSSRCWQRPEVLGSPCLLCGTWTGNWCESCDRTQHPLCTICEESGYVCPWCDSDDTSLPINAKIYTIRLRSHSLTVLRTLGIDPGHWTPSARMC